MNRPDSFSPLLFRLYASDLSEAVYQMGATAELRRALHRNDIEVRFGGGRQFVTMDGKTVELDANASADDVARALNVAKVDDAVNALSAAPVVATAPAPAIPAPTIAPIRKPVAPGSFAASLKSMMDEAVAGVEQAKADGLTKVRTAVGKLGEAKAATVRVTDNMVTNIEDQAASIMSELGQISNDL
jgi:hypothetical protein